MIILIGIALFIVFIIVGTIIQAIEEVKATSNINKIAKMMEQDRRSRK